MFKIQQAQKVEYKKIRDRELAALKREVAARHKSELARKEAEEKLKEVQEAMDNHQREMEEANDKIARLEKQLQETQVLHGIFALATTQYAYF